MERLTKKQAIVYEYLLSESKKNGYPPGIRDICVALGMRSTSTVHNHLTVLEEKGYIRRHPTRTRSIEIVEKEYESSPQRSELREEIFLHTVQDDNMRQEGIIRGDTVICRRAATATDGQIVAVWSESGLIALQKYDTASKAEVVGIASELRRRY